MVGSALKFEESFFKTLRACPNRAFLPRELVVLGEENWGNKRAGTDKADLDSRLRQSARATIVLDARP